MNKDNIPKHLQNLEEFEPTTQNVWERGRQLNEWISTRREKRWKEQNEFLGWFAIIMVLLPTVGLVILSWLY